jgi:hypothetical protein
MAAHRRQSSLRSRRTRADDAKNRHDVSLEHRVEVLETALADVRRLLDTQSNRTTAIQAQLDHLTANRVL